MSHKRSRNDFEGFHGNKHGKHLKDGTPYNPNLRADGSIKNPWEQDVRDEQGRRRLHGAFTGGFSAGHFNTVGSKEGWTPQTFVSSRTNRATTQQRVEDYMDEEDIDEAEESETLQVAGVDAALGGNQGGGASGNDLLDMVRSDPNHEISYKTLEKMGWKRGQGIGPKVTRKARFGGLSEEGGGDDEKHSFENEDVEHSGRSLRNAQDIDEHHDTNVHDVNRSRFRKPDSKERKTGFGVGILNDTGSDDEDPYEIGPKISYNRRMGGDKKLKKKSVGGANPLVSTKPVYLPKKIIPGQTTVEFRRLQDDTLPLEEPEVTQKKVRPVAETPFETPEGVRSEVDARDSSLARTPISTDKELLRAQELDPTAMERLHRPKPVHGNSVFDFISPSARDRLAKVSGREDLPVGKGGEAPQGSHRPEAVKQKTYWDLVPELSQVIALEALQRGAMGWMPYAEDEAKRARYKAFIELKAGTRTTLPERVQGHTNDDWRNEMNEFAQAAEVFRPMTGIMATRFTSSRQTFEGTRDPTKSYELGEERPLLSKPTAKPEDPAEHAAKMGMHGYMTRSTLPFYPTKLLCKRFNVRPPANVGVDPGSGFTGEGGDAEQSVNVKEVLPKQAIERMMQDAAIRRFASAGYEGGTTPGPIATKMIEAVKSEQEPQAAKQVISDAEIVQESSAVDPERSGAAKEERPGMDVFRAIFGNSDDEDEE